MSDSPQRSFTAASLVLAVIAAVVAASLALGSLTSPLNDATLSSSVAIQSSSGDAVFASLVAAVLSALIIGSLVAPWSQPVRLSVCLAAAGIMTAAGCIAARMLDPASASLQARFMVYPHGDGMAAPIAASNNFPAPGDFQSCATAHGTSESAELPTCCRRDSR